MLMAVVTPADLREDMLANGIYEGAEPAGIVHAAGLDRRPNATKRFLAHIFDCARVNAASAQSDPQAFTKVGDKMGFGASIMSPETAEVFLIERIEVHRRSLKPVYVRLCC